MRAISIIIVLFSISNFGYGQNFAGDDDEACQSVGALIGNSEASDDNCYRWEIADGLDESQEFLKTPFVKPSKTTTYTVHVTGPDFSFTATDQVKVVVEFGGIEFNPKYAKPIVNFQVQATLTIPGDAPDWDWSIEETDGTGCTIDPNTGLITNCTEKGEITVRATRTDITTCYAEKKLQVNFGVKDLLANDLDHAGRMVGDGDTLYLVESGNVLFTAIPNDDSSFPEDEPNWFGTIDVPSGNQNSFTHNFSTGAIPTNGILDNIIVSDEKKVWIKQVDPDVNTIAFNFNSGGVSNLYNRLKGNTKKVKQYLESPCNPFELELPTPSNLNLSWKSEKVPKFQHPGISQKETLTIQFPVGLSGCAYFPCCYGYYGFLFYYAKVQAGVSIAADISMIYDPSIEAIPEWKSSNFLYSATGTLAAAVGAEVNLFGVSGVIVEANLSTSVKAQVRKAQSSSWLEQNYSWGGLVGKVSGAVWTGSPDNTIGIAFQHNFIPGAETGWSNFYFLGQPN